MVKVMTQQDKQDKQDKERISANRDKIQLCICLGLCIFTGIYLLVMIILLDNQ